MDVVLLGPPGVGKGTQAAGLVAATGLAHVASGDLFRHHLASGTELGRAAKSYIERGELVPDEVVIDMMLTRIQEPDCADGVVFDGFPRTLAQAEQLDQALADRPRAIDLVVALTADTDVLLRRIVGRQTCTLCGAAYNTYYTPSRHGSACELCGGDLEGRSDDNPETARKRYDVYVEQTEPLVGYYRDRGLLYEVDASRNPDEVTADILERLRAVAGSRST
jgi:adenylate kinase